MDKNEFFDAKIGELDNTQQYKITNNMFVSGTLLNEITIMATGKGRVSIEEWEILKQIQIFAKLMLNKDIILSNFTIDGLI